MDVKRPLLQRVHSDDLAHGHQAWDLVIVPSGRAAIKARAKPERQGWGRGELGHQDRHAHSVPDTAALRPFLAASSRLAYGFSTTETDGHLLFARDCSRSRWGHTEHSKHTECRFRGRVVGVQAGGRYCA